MSIDFKELYKFFPFEIMPKILYNGQSGLFLLNQFIDLSNTVASEVGPVQLHNFTREEKEGERRKRRGVLIALGGMGKRFCFLHCFQLRALE